MNQEVVNGEIVLWEGQVVAMPIKTAHHDFIEKLEKNRDIEDAGWISDFLIHHLIHQIKVYKNDKSLHKLADIVWVWTIPPIITVKNLLNHPKSGSEYDSL